MWDTWIAAAALSLAVIGSVGSIAMWLSGKFDNLFTKVTEKLEKSVEAILDKFEEHEKEDNRRFDQIKTDIWEIKVLNAAKDGVVMRSSFDQKDETAKRS